MDKIIISNLVARGHYRRDRVGAQRATGYSGKYRVVC